MLSRLLKYATKNIIRNKFLSISSILVLTLLMFFVDILIVLHDVSTKLINSVNSKMNISLYLKDDYNEKTPELKYLFEDIKKFSPTITIDFKNKEQVLSQLEKNNNEIVGILWNTNPFPSTVTIWNIDLKEYSQLKEIVSKSENLFFSYKKNSKDLYSFSSQYERIQKIISILNSLQLWLIVIISVFLFSIWIIMYFIIWNFIYSYREEINVTQLVWGKKIFIYWPFSIQWSIYAMISCVISSILFYFLISNINFIGQEQSVWYKFWQNLFLILILEFFIYSLVWAISGFISSYKFSKK